MSKKAYETPELLIDLFEQEAICYESTPIFDEEGNDEIIGGDFGDLIPS